MAELYEIRAEFDNSTITVYQAYNKSIAEKAARDNKFGEPFSFNRMTWIKPSFLWMMERCGWCSKANQEHVLAIKIKRDSFEYALSNAVLTSNNKRVYSDVEEWQRIFKTSNIRVQWDPERDIRSQKLDYRSIQIGISRNLIEEYNDKWICEINDITPLVKKIYKLKNDGNLSKAKSFLPKERVYPLPESIKKTVGMI